MKRFISLLCAAFAAMVVVLPALELPALAQERALLDSVALVSKKEFTALEQALKDPDAVYRLDLSYSGLTDFPREILLFTNLQSLNLSNNGIAEIPPEITRLTRLQRLNLSTNGLKRLPAEISSLKYLKWLDVTQNQFLTSELGKVRAALPLASITD
jgi:Leucine-rich repeat (LRR) protein